jgi:hypothetical protein
VGLFRGFSALDSNPAWPTARTWLEKVSQAEAALVNMERGLDKLWHTVQTAENISAEEEHRNMLLKLDYECEEEAFD